MTQPSPRRQGDRVRVTFTLPKSLVADLGRYAAAFSGLNRSRFVAEALRWYAEYLTKAEHTRRLRRSYAAAAGKTRDSVAVWEPLAREAWDELEGRDDRSSSRT